MGLLDSFRKKPDPEKETHLMMLIIIVLEDGRIKDTELSFLYHRAEKMGISKSKVGELIDQYNENPNSFRFVVPKKNHQIAELFSNMIMIMMVDGNISEREKKLIYRLAEKIGFYEEIYIDMFIRLVSDGVLQNKEYDVIVSKIIAQLQKMSQKK